MRTMRLRELRVTPHTDPTNDGRAPWMLDGEYLPPGAMHLRVLQRKLRVFASPHSERYDIVLHLSVFVFLFFFFSGFLVFLKSSHTLLSLRETRLDRLVAYLKQD